MGLGMLCLLVVLNYYVLYELVILYRFILF